MTNSRRNSRRSIASMSKLLAVAVAVVAVLGAGRVAEAGRKRVVVLDFEGPRSEKFHDDLVRLIKKTHTVVPAEKWNGTAEQLGAGTRSNKDVRKVARKLKIDAIVEGKIEKRRDAFIIRLKLRAGKSGELIGGSIDTKAEGPRIDGRAQKDLKDELVGKIDDVASNHDGAGGDDADDDPPVRRAGRPPQGDDDDDRPARKPARADQADNELPRKTARKGARKDDDADDDRPAKRGKFGGHLDDERGSDKVGKAKKPEPDDDDKLPPKKIAKASAKPAQGDDDDDKLPPRKPAGTSAAGDDARRAQAPKVASREDDEGSAEAEVEVEDTAKRTGADALAPGERFLDAALGMSFTARRFTFAYSAALRARPNNYRGVPAPGALVDVTVYPLAFGHTRHDVVKDLGLEVVYDRVLGLNSKVPAEQNGMTTTVTYSTLQSRFALTAVYRHVVGRSPTAPVVLGTLGYQRQQFNILGQVDLPDVKYSLFVLGVGIRFPVTSRLILDADGKLLLPTSTGEIENPDQYGQAKVYGFDVSVGADYLLTPNVFVRAAGRAEVFSFTFAGTGSLSNGRDNNPMTQDVFGASDHYLGGFLTVGYLY